MPGGEIICDPIFFGRKYPEAARPSCFVIMPFGVAILQDIYREYVKPAVEECGLTCFRGDDIFSVGSIMEDVWESLCCSKIVIGDFTGRNPNVLYEAGITHTLGKPLICITQEVDDIPFDFRHIRAVVYSASPSGLRQLAQNVKNTIRGLLKDERRSTPRPVPDVSAEVDRIAEILLRERAQTARMYDAIEERHADQIRHFHQVVSELRVEFSEVQPPEFCFVPGCTLSVDEYDDEHGAVVRGQRARVGSFRITKFPISNALYHQFSKITGHYPPEHWNGPEPSRAIQSHPVVGVSWNDTVAFCAWLSQALRTEVRLPTEEEWLAAAGYGLDGRKFPWGPEWQDDQCNSREFAFGGLTEVTRFPDGRSPVGCWDMLGNVWEWTSSLYTTEGGVPWRAVRGGANYSELRKAGSLARLVAYPGHFLFVRDLGFRVVASVDREDA